MVISLSILGPNIKKLIKGHGGSLPLATLKTCYEAEFEVIYDIFNLRLVNFKILGFQNRQILNNEFPALTLLF